MKITKLLVVVLSLVLMASVPASAVTVTSGLIAAHDAGAGWDGTNLSDQVTGDGYDATGTLVGSVTHTAASGGNPAYFSFGTDQDYIALDAIPTVLGTGDFTVQMWVNVSSANDDILSGGLLGDALMSGVTNFGFGLGQHRMSVGGGVGGQLYAAGMHDDEGPPAGAEPWAGWQASISNNQEGGVFDGTWHLITATRTAPGAMPDSGMRIWADATEDTVNFAEPFALFDMALATLPLDINGGFTAAGSTNKYGRLKEGDMVNKVLLYNRALTQAEITQNFNAGVTDVVPEPGTLAVLGIGAVLVALIRRRRA